MDLKRTIVAILGVVVVAGACSSASTATPGGPAAPASYAASAPSAQAAPPASGSNGPASASSAPASAAAGGGGGSLTDACALLTEAQVTAALGVTVGAGAPPGPGQHSCLWSDKDVTYTVELSITDGGVFNDTEGGSMSGITITKVSGIGDAAYYFDGGVVFSLYFAKSSNYFSIAVLAGMINDRLTQDEERAIEKTLALEVLANV